MTQTTHPLNRRELLRRAALTETVLLGNIAYRVGGRIEWDSKHMTAANTQQVERYLRRDYRQGWTL